MNGSRDASSSSDDGSSNGDESDYVPHSSRHKRDVLCCGPAYLTRSRKAACPGQKPLSTLEEKYYADRNCKVYLTRCGVTEDFDNKQKQLTKVVWPPPSNSSASTSWGRSQFANPNFGTKMQLFSRTNFNLAVYADGSVSGTQDDNDLHTYLELKSAGYPGHVRIQGTLTNMYIAMDQRGLLYGETDMYEEGTVFIESLRGLYNTYLSRKYAHQGWYLGIKKSGKYKKGPKTASKQRAVQFLPRRSRFN